MATASIGFGKGKEIDGLLIRSSPAGEVVTCLNDIILLEMEDSMSGLRRIHRG